MGLMDSGDISGLHLVANTKGQFSGLLYFLSKFFNFSSSVVSEYELLKIVANFLFLNKLPNWTLASYSFLMGSRIGSNHHLVLDDYLLPHKDLEFAAL